MTFRVTLHNNSEKQSDITLHSTHEN